MAEVDWRAIDIDQYDEENALASELYPEDPRGEGALLQEAQRRQQLVRDALQRCVSSVAVDDDRGG